jgi:hypothetical protein
MLALDEYSGHQNLRDSDRWSVIPYVHRRMRVILLKRWLFSRLPCVALRVLMPDVFFYSTRLMRSHCNLEPDRWPQDGCPIYRRGTLARNNQWWCWWPDECHITSLCHIVSMHNIVRVNGPPGTVAALLRCGVRSPRTVACPLRMSGRFVSYCRRLAASMSCMYLMSVIRCVWPVTYIFNALPAPRSWRGHDEPGVRRLGNARAHPRAESHWARGGSGAFPH